MGKQIPTTTSFNLPDGREVIIETPLVLEIHTPGECDGGHDRDGLHFIPLRRRDQLELLGEDIRNPPLLLDTA